MVLVGSIALTKGTADSNLFNLCLLILNELELRCTRVQQCLQLRHIKLVFEVYVPDLIANKYYESTPEGRTEKLMN